MDTPASPPERIDCRACREPIVAGARLCPHCGSSQTSWKSVATTLKWMGGIATVISFVVGMHSLYALYQVEREKYEAVRELTQAAERLRDEGNYQRAWGLYDEAKALRPASRLVRRGQEDLALQWLPHARVVGKESFLTIVDHTLPVLLRGMVRAQGARAADFQALIGWAHYLERRERHVSDVDIPGIYRRALALHAQNTYAHAFLGHWLATEESDIVAARPHFQAALQTGRERAFVRRFQWAALKNRLRKARTGSPEDINVRQELLRVAWDVIRSQGQDGDDGIDWSRLTAEVFRSYGRRYRAEHFEALWPALTPEEHRKLLEHLLTIDDGSQVGGALQARFVLGRIEEKVGNVKGALQAYRVLDGDVSGKHALRQPLDEALQRLAGETTAYALERQDPLGYHGNVLLNAAPDSADFDRSMKYVDSFIDAAMQERRRASWPRALAVLERASQRLRAMLVQDGGDAERLSYIRQREWTVRSRWSALLLLSRELDKTVEVLQEFITELPATAWTRRGALYNLACAYSLRSGTYGVDTEGTQRQRTDIDHGVQRLAEAIQGGYDAWDHIKRDTDLDALREHPRYMQLMTGR